MCFYFNDCSTFLPPNLKDIYPNPDSLASKFQGLELVSDKKDLRLLLCKGNFKADDAYLLVFKKDGTFLSGIQTDVICTNKVASFHRSCLIKEDLSIEIKDFQKFANKIECSTNKGFEVNYIYQINKKGIIIKKSEILKTF